MNKITAMVGMFVLLVTGTAYGAHTQYGVRHNGARPVGEYRAAVEQILHNISKTEEQVLSRLHEWARRGDSDSFNTFLEKTRALRYQKSGVCKDGNVLVAGLSGEESCMRPEVLLKTDAFKNNLLHNAKDLKTLESIETLFQYFFQYNSSYLNSLKNEKNLAGETPLIAHINRGDLDSFWSLYMQSTLQSVLDKMGDVANNSSRLVKDSSLEIYRQEILKYGADAAGVTFVELIKRNPNSYQKNELLYALEREIPVLF